MKLWRRWCARRKARAFIQKGQTVFALAVLHEAYGENGLDVWIAMTEEKERDTEFRDYMLVLIGLCIWAVIVSFLESL